MKTLLLFFSLLVVSSLWADSYNILYQKGTVEITRDGKLVAPPVKPGDRVHVHKGGLLVLKSAREVLKLMSDTIITPQETVEDSKEGTIIDLVKGAIISQVNKKPFKVISKSTAFGVRGTEFFVQATDDSDLWMCVQEGRVNVKNKNSTVDVPAGQGVFVGEKEISKPQAYAWTKGINWKMTPDEGDLDHKLDLKYDLLENFYD